MMNVSVIVPTRNGSSRIAKTVSNIRSQTLPAFETVIIDDCSDDDTWEVLLDIAAHDEKVRIHRNTHPLGAAGSRNVGIRLASGDYVAFLDDDDEWHADKLADQVSLAEKNTTIGLVGCGMVHRFLGSSMTYTSIPPVEEFSVESVLMENYLGGTVSVMARRQALLEAGLFDQRFTAREEYDLWIRVALLGWKIVAVRKPLMTVWHSSRSDRISSNIVRYEEACQLLNSKHADVIHQRTWAFRRKRVAQQMFFLGAQSSKADLKSKSLIYFLKSVLYFPSSKAVLAFLGSVIGPSFLTRMRGVIRVRRY